MALLQLRILMHVLKTVTVTWQPEAGPGRMTCRKSADGSEVSLGPDQYARASAA